MNNGVNRIDLRNGRQKRINGNNPVIHIDRALPSSLDSEKGVIGCCLKEPKECINECIRQFGNDIGDVFYDPKHQIIFETLLDLTAKMKPVDMITVLDHLRGRKMLEMIGGIEYLNELEDVPSAANLSYYVDEVREKYTLRCVIKLCHGFTKRIYEGDGTADELLENFEKEALAIRRFKSGSDEKLINEIVDTALVEIETMINRKGEIGGLSTGLPDLDRESDGLHGGEYILIAAFPSVGKSSLAMNIVEHVVLNLGLPVGIFSAEMSAASLMKRSIASIGRVNLRDIRREGKCSDDDRQRILTAASRLSVSKLHIDDSSDMTIQVVRAKARRMVQQHGVKLIVADYVQMFNSPGAENRTIEIDQISKGFKNMAKELNVPVIVLSQLTEDSKGNIHMKGAKALGEDGDGCWELKRRETKDAKASDPTETVELWLRKQRNEARNVCIPLTFFKTFTRFESATKLSEEPDLSEYTK